MGIGNQYRYERTLLDETGRGTKQQLVDNAATRHPGLYKEKFLPLSETVTTVAEKWRRGERLVEELIGSLLHRPFNSSFSEIRLIQVMADNVWKFNQFLLCPHQRSLQSVAH